MKAKLKRMSIVLFLTFFLNDFCQYIKVFVDNGRIGLRFFSLFYADMGNNIIIFNISFIYLAALMFLYFVTHFFRKEKKYDYNAKII